MDLNIIIDNAAMHACMHITRLRSSHRTHETMPRQTVTYCLFRVVSK